MNCAMGCTICAARGRMPTHTPIGTQIEARERDQNEHPQHGERRQTADLQRLLQRRVLDQHPDDVPEAEHHGRDDQRHPQQVETSLGSRRLSIGAYRCASRRGWSTAPPRETRRSPPESGANGASWSAPRSRAPAPRAPARRGNGPPTPPTAETAIGRTAESRSAWWRSPSRWPCRFFCAMASAMYEPTPGKRDGGMADADRFGGDHEEPAARHGHHHVPDERRHAERHLQLPEAHPRRQPERLRRFR